MLPTSPGFSGRMPSPVICWSSHLISSADQYSPSPMQSRPISTWRFTTSATTGTTCAATSSPPTSPRARRRAVSSKPEGTGSRPTWLVRILCALFFIGLARGIWSCFSPLRHSYNDRHTTSTEHRGARMTTEGTAGIRKSNRRWQSDVIVDLIKHYDFPYIALNPGASFRGLHDSLVNYGENEPPMLLCNHEKIAV